MTTLARIPRLTNIVLNRVGSLVPGLTVESHEDGRVSITLPLQWASLLLGTLQAQAADFREKLQRATFQAQAREAESQAQTVDAEARWQRTNAATYAAYKRYIRQGLSHRAALHKLKTGEQWTITLLEDVVQKQAAQERREQRAKRDARIMQLAQRMTTRQIADREGLTLWSVQEALRRERGRRDGQGDSIARAKGRPKQHRLR